MNIDRYKKKPCDKHKVSVYLSDENQESIDSLKDFMGIPDINRSSLINQALTNYFKNSFRYISKCNEVGEDFIRVEIPIHQDMAKVLRMLADKHGTLKLAMWFNYTLYGKLINSNLPLSIGKVAEVDELSEMIKEFAGKVIPQEKPKKSEDSEET